MYTGFIGTGSMGTVLIESFIRAGALRPEEIIAMNRTRSKAESLSSRYQGLRVADSAGEVAAKSRILFLCVKPLQFPALVAEIAPRLSADTIAVSITSPVMIRQLEDRLPCKVAKFIPSITNYMLSGALLCMYGSRIGVQDKLLLENLACSISRPIEIAEEHARISSDITSCGPAFMSLLLQKFVDSAAAVAGIPREQAEKLACEMLLGTGMLLTAGGLTPQDVQKRVAVPGGITEEGLHLLDRELKDVFTQLVGITHAKYDEDVEKTEAAFRSVSP